MKKVTTESWICEVSKIHNNKYDYSKVKYENNKAKVIIICPIHGEFEQVAKDHLKGSGCSICGRIKHEESRRLNTEEFIVKSKITHGDLYDYSKVEYINARTKVCIVCNKHGEFWQNPNNHTQGQGCPVCSSSKGELLIRKWLLENNIKFKEQFELITPEIARNSNVMIVDFFVKHNGKQYFIEYDGKQHYEYVPYFHRGGIIEFEKQQRRDKVLNEFCELHKDKVTLIRFKYNQKDETIINKLKQIFTWLPF